MYVAPAAEARREEREDPAGLLASCGYPAETAQRAVEHEGLHVPRSGDQEGCDAGAQKTPSPQFKEAGEMS